MGGMRGGRLVLLFFSLTHKKQPLECALVNWFVYDGDEPVRDPDTGMYMVHLERDRRGKTEIQVISVDSIIRGAHLLPVYGEGRVPRSITYSNVLDKGRSFFINHYVDHHVHELVLG